jgi:O-methyltransferase involved in polyketide biosynthesis
MMDLSQVSRTAILLLICRAIEAEKSGFDDALAVLCLERLTSSASEEDRRWIKREKRVYGGIEANHRKAGVRRVKKFDAAANRFIADHPGCTVINLACGFDTRFWRIANEKCHYIEIDLPAVIELKKELLKDQIGYETIGCSVLDSAWIDQVTANGNSGFLLLAEGLFDWIPREEAVRLLFEIGKRFDRSQLVLDVVPAKYKQGIWKFLMRLEARISWGLDVVWVAGIKDARDIEACAPGLKVIGEQKGSAGPIITVAVGDLPPTP